jgi:hypothetical protein
MDASQYKDYILVLLFIKYVSDKYAGVRYAPITIPPGSSFKDMIALKGKSDIGDQINKKIIAPLANANKLSDMPDFNDPGKLGSGKEMVDRLTNLIAIFENKALDFSKNRADGDDILGDAYEYLMRHFATESGKSKGQFYTPAEVSRVIAQTVGIRSAKATSSTTVYDPTCGSGSLLLKVGDEAGTPVTLYGQEKDAEAWSTAKNQVLVTQEFLDEQFMYRLVNMRTHRRSGDMAIVKMFEVGYKRTGDIQPVRITNQSQAGVVVAAGGTMREVYKVNYATDEIHRSRTKFPPEALSDIEAHRAEAHRA